MNPLESLAKEAMIKAKSDIFKIEHNEVRYWVKKGRTTISSNLHKLYYMIFPFEVLIPVKSKSALETIEYETSKLDLFREHGINTPKVLFKNESFFILEDCGRNINSYLRRPEITKEEMYYFIDLFLEQLALIHNNRYFHGGAQTRNFTYKEGKVYAIDLEESFENIELEVLQFRDFLLFLLSLSKTRASFDLDYTYIIQKYIALTQNHFVLERLKNVVKKISFLMYLLQIRAINKILGKDVQGFIKLFKQLKTIKGIK